MIVGFRGLQRAGDICRSLVDAVERGRARCWL